MTNAHAFDGAKVMVFLGSDILVLHRDFTPGIPWPGRLDFPGGGREGSETPMACACRETFEEVGLILDQAQLKLAHTYRSADRVSYFYAVHLPSKIEQEVVFGGEGAGWSVMSPAEYVQSPDAIPHFAQILTDYIKCEKGGPPLVG